MKKYIVTLTAEERQALGDLIAAGKAAAQKLAHARILLKADAAEGAPAVDEGPGTPGRDPRPSEAPGGCGLIGNAARPGVPPRAIRVYPF